MSRTAIAEPPVIRPGNKMCTPPTIPPTSQPLDGNDTPRIVGTRTRLSRPAARPGLSWPGLDAQSLNRFVIYTSNLICKRRGSNAHYNGSN